MTTNEIDKPDPVGTVLTVSDAALFLRVSESIVRRMIHEGRIPYFRIEGRYLFYRPLLEQWITEISIAPERTPPIAPNIDQAGKIWGMGK